MDYTWDLDVIYKGIDSKEFKSDFEAVDGVIEKINSFAEHITHENEVQSLHDILMYQIKLSELEYKLANYLSLNMSTDTTNSAYASLMGTLQAKSAKASKAFSIFDHYIADVEKLDEVIDKDALLKEHEYILKKTKEDASHLLSNDAEDVISRLSVDSVSAWGNLQDFLTSTVEVNYRGETINLPAIRNLAYSDDKEVRKEAYEAELNAYDAIKESIAFSLNSIKGYVNTICDLRGFASPLEQALNSNHMQRKTLDAMFEAIDEYLPKFHAYLRRKGELLGYDNGLPWYELFAPMGKSSSGKFTVEESKEYLLKQFSTFSDDMCEMIERAYDERWIDFLPHKGKVGGAFCGGIECIKQSRILTNFDGSLSDVVTLAHELGHAYHNLHSFDHSIINNGNPMQLAETASTFNETVVMNSAIRNATDKDEKLKLIESTLSDLTQVICDIYSRYLFESEVFDKRRTSFMYAEDLKTIMEGAQKKAYGNGLDHNYLHPYMWVCKSHYYSSYSFYNFPYAFGALFARGLYAKYEKEGSSFVEGYQKLLNSTSLMDTEEVAKMAGIDITTKDFWCSSLEGVASLIDEFMELTK